MLNPTQQINQFEEDSAPLPNILKWKKDLIIENGLRFDMAKCGSGLFISDENTVLRKNIMANQWSTCRTIHGGWNEGVHYWSIRLIDRGAAVAPMIGIVSSNFDTNLVQYPGKTADSYGFFLHDGTKYKSGARIAFNSDLPKNNDVIGVLLDLDARMLTYFKNGQLLGSAFGEIPIEKSITYYPAIGLHSLGQWVSLIKTTK